MTEAKVIIRNVYNSDGLRIANVQHLEPGDKILLAYGGKGKPYKPVFCCTVKMAVSPVRHDEHSFDVFAYIDESLSERLRNSDYTPDPVLDKFVGISIADLKDLRQLSCTVPRPAGNNTLRRWAEVFS